MDGGRAKKRKEGKPTRKRRRRGKSAGIPGEQKQRGKNRGLEVHTGCFLCSFLLERSSPKCGIVDFYCSCFWLHCYSCMFLVTSFSFHLLLGCDYSAILSFSLFFCLGLPCVWVHPNHVNALVHGPRIHIWKWGSISLHFVFFLFFLSLFLPWGHEDFFSFFLWDWSRLGGMWGGFERERGNCRKN